VHPRTFAEFERICAARGAAGRVLEIGAVPCDETLLCLPSLRAATEKVGLNLDGPSRWRDFEIVPGNANAMPFPDERFDVVVCNAVLEHDPFFWKTLAEIRRVTSPGGLVVLGAPGYTALPSAATPARAKRRLIGWLGRVPLLSGVSWWLKSTPTVEIHDAPGDYYRFTPQAFREVLLEGLEEVEVGTILFPPVVVGAGRLPCPAGARL
jgi:SAM-dependent methyltransferase